MVKAEDGMNDETAENVIKSNETCFQYIRVVWGKAHFLTGKMPVPLLQRSRRNRGKVLTLLTMLITNDLSVYKTVYTFFKVFTSLVINDLSVYINVNGNNWRRSGGQVVL
jgi:hypothetical protein